MLPLPFIEPRERQAMLALARRSLENHWHPACGAEPPSLPHGDLQLGCFVSLHRQGVLRGCIGTLEPEMPLIEAIPRFALAAALQDPRFAPLQEDELPHITLSLSLLGPLTPLPAESRAALLGALIPGEDGLWLSDGFRRATFLPAVWRELPDPQDFVNQLLRKGGWPADPWPEALQAWRYHSLEFAETDPH